MRGSLFASFRPTEYVDVETGDRIVVTTQKFFDQTRFRKLAVDGALEQLSTANPGGVNLTFLEELGSGAVRGRIQVTREIDVFTLSFLWRLVLKRFLLLTTDDVNALRITRGLHLALPFMTGYEAYLLDNVIGAFEGGDATELAHALAIGFRNRNVSRVIVQQLGVDRCTPHPAPRSLPRRARPRSSDFFTPLCAICSHLSSHLCPQLRLLLARRHVVPLESPLRRLRPGARAPQHRRHRHRLGTGHLAVRRCP